MANLAKMIASDISPSVIPMGTDLRASFTPPSEPRQASHNRLIFVGRLVEVKGVPHLVRALGQLLPAYPDLHLKIIGDGPLRFQVESLVKELSLSDHVSFLGALTHEQIPKHLKQADIAVFPSAKTRSGIEEGFGLVMVEALGCGCVLVASDSSASRLISDDGRHASLVGAGDPLKLANGIERAIRERCGNEGLAVDARQYVLRLFDWAAVKEDFTKVYLD
jgi:glycosyltransferase involved in cell wall biosynthesis